MGSQMRGPSHAMPAILAEGRGSPPTNISIEAMDGAMQEARETQHRLEVAKDKRRVTGKRVDNFAGRHGQCGRTLENPHQALSGWQGTTRTGSVVRKAHAEYGSDSCDWDHVAAMILIAGMELP